MEYKKNEYFVVDKEEIKQPRGNQEQENLKDMVKLYDEVLLISEQISKVKKIEHDNSKIQELIKLYDTVGKSLQSIISEEENFNVLPFSTNSLTQQAEASRLISKLRDKNTGHQEFLYYTQRAYEMLFKEIFVAQNKSERHYRIVETPVNRPQQNYGVHKIPQIDLALNSCVMGVLLRAALLPSMIISKEIQEYSSKNYMTPFALFKIQRDESEGHLRYVLDLKRSYFDLDKIAGSNLIFADPMNATGGSVITIMKYLNWIGVEPKSITIVNILTSLQGGLQILRSVKNARVFTLWLDPALNDISYIMPGLGDAGDRINGLDGDDPRNLIQLIADLGLNLSTLYRQQIKEIEQTVLA